MADPRHALSTPAARVIPRPVQLLTFARISKRVALRGSWYARLCPECAKNDPDFPPLSARMKRMPLRLRLACASCAQLIALGLLRGWGRWFPSTDSYAPSRSRYVDDLGLKLVESVEIRIGGEVAATCNRECPKCRRTRSYEMCGATARELNVWIDTWCSPYCSDCNPEPHALSSGITLESRPLDMYIPPQMFVSRGPAWPPDSISAFAPELNIDSDMEEID